MRRRYLGSVSCDITMSRCLAPFFFISVVQAEQPAKSLKMLLRQGRVGNKQTNTWKMTLYPGPSGIRA